MFKNEGNYRAWYVGVASDPRERLFNDHNVQEQTDFWIYSKHLGSDMAARKIERHFLSKGCNGAAGGGDTASCHVYAYKINTHTRE
jgi:hypothetical protein